VNFTTKNNNKTADIMMNKKVNFVEINKNLKENENYQENNNKITIPKVNYFKNHGSAKDLNKNFDLNRNKLENKDDRKEDEFNSSFGSNSTNNFEEEYNININEATIRKKSDKFKRRYTDRKNSNIVKLLPCYQKISPPKERKRTSDNGTIIVLKNIQYC